ncbi:hypothetical protein HDU97_003959 [Phlyctochytrium planicorne]|nr:hypothetical protein HDU97_003959 [Phlyctochytrium planicorne]
MTSAGKVKWRNPGAPPLPSSNPLSRFLSAITLAFSTIFNIFSVLVMSFNMAIFGRLPLISHRYLSGKHKIIVLGDDFAYGVGDNIAVGASPGLTSHLHKMIRSDKRLKHRWLLYNRGVLASTSSDWLPSKSRVLG